MTEASSVRVLSLIHDPTWTESRIHDELRDRGHQVELCCHPAGDPLPGVAELGDRFGAVVVNGGPVSTWQASEHPFMAAEIEFASEVIAAGVPYLGLCLGAHVLGAAVGVSTEARPDGVAEYGFCPIEPTAAGISLFADLDHVFQCHYEALTELPVGAELLATSPLFRIQAFRLATEPGAGATIGLQFHPDARADMIEGWWAGNAATAARPGTQPLAEQRIDAERFEPARAAFVSRLVDRWLAETGETQDPHRQTTPTRPEVGTR
ncbi:MAG: hypothetical protein AAGA93_05965 [Actinomycetota bacterium]